MSKDRSQLGRNSNPRYECDDWIGTSPERLDMTRRSHKKAYGESVDSDLGSRIRARISQGQWGVQ